MSEEVKEETIVSKMAFLEVYFQKYSSGNIIVRIHQSLGAANPSEVIFRNNKKKKGYLKKLPTSF